MHSISRFYTGRYSAISRLLSDPHLWFYCALILWMSWRFFDQSLYVKYILAIGELNIRAAVFLFILLHELLSRQGKQTIYGILGIALAFAIGVATDSYMLIDPIVFIFSARSVPFRSIAKVALATTIIVPGFIIISSQIGLIADYLWERESGNFIRHSLGFRYTTFSTHMLLSAVLLYVYIKKEKSSLFILGILLLATYDLYKLTDSRTSFLLTLAFLAGVLVLKLRALSPLYTKTLQYLTASLPWLVFPVMSYVLAISYDKNNPTDVRLNKLLSNRLLQTKETLEEYNLTLFGENIKVKGHGVDANGNVIQVLAGETSNYVDNSFINSLLNNGVILTVIALILLAFVGAYSARHNQKFLSLILFVIALHSLIDPQLLLLQYTPFLLLISTYPSILHEGIEKGNGIREPYVTSIKNSSTPYASHFKQNTELQESGLKH